MLTAFANFYQVQLIPVIGRLICVSVCVLCGSAGGVDTLMLGSVSLSQVISST